MWVNQKTIMAINKSNDWTESEGSIHLSNGDFQALKKIAKTYGLPDESDVIAFAISILNGANGKPVFYKNESGLLAGYLPSDDLLGR
jgi:hypothetical protein